MCSLLQLAKGKVKVFPIIIDEFPRAADYPDTPHITTGKKIRRTLMQLLRQQGKKIKVDDIADVVPVLVAKLNELESGANTSSIVVPTGPTSMQQDEESEIYVNIQGITSPANSLRINLSATLKELREKIREELEFDFEYRFFKDLAMQLAVALPQESKVTVSEVIGANSTITVYKK